MTREVCGRGPGPLGHGNPRKGDQATRTCPRTPVPTHLNHEGFPCRVRVEEDKKAGCVGWVARQPVAAAVGAGRGGGSCVFGDAAIIRFAVSVTRPQCQLPAPEEISQLPEPHQTVNSIWQSGCASAGWGRGVFSISINTTWVAPSVFPHVRLTPIDLCTVLHATHLRPGKLPTMHCSTLTLYHYYYDLPYLPKFELKYTRGGKSYRHVNYVPDFYTYVKGNCFSCTIVWKEWFFAEINSASSRQMWDMVKAQCA